MPGDADRDTAQVGHRVDERNLGREGRSHVVGRETDVRDEEDGPEVARRIEPERLDPALGRGADREPAEDRRRGVVGMTLDRRRQAEQVGRGQRLAEEAVARHEPGDRRRGRRPEAARQRDLVAHVDPPSDALRDLAADLAQGRLDPAHAAVRPIGRQLADALRRRPSARSRRGSSRGPRPRPGRQVRARVRGSRSRRRGWRSSPGPRPSPAGRRARRASSSPSERDRHGADRRLGLDDADPRRSASRLSPDP